MYNVRTRKKSWKEKVKLTRNSYLRSVANDNFARYFYENLFFLEPKIKTYFKNTEFEHQEKALVSSLKFMFGFLDKRNTHSRNQILRLARTHSLQGLNIHPHHYYYWIEAIVLTAKKCDPKWYKDMEYYWREVISFPVTFMISQYFNMSDD